MDEKIFDMIKEKDRHSVLLFLEYLKSNKMSVNGSKIMHKGKRMGGFNINKDNVFVLSIQTQFDELFNDLISRQSEEIKNFVKEQSGYTGCGRCITGKCSATHLNMENPDESLLILAQKLLALRCEAISNKQVPKCNYIKISDRGMMKKCAKCKICDPACRKLKNF